MLHEIVKYAERENLAAEPGFGPKSARWALICDGAGTYLGIVELGEVDAKVNRGMRFLRAPDLSQPEMKAGGITKSHFLIDSASAVVGYGKDAVPEKQEYFVRLLERAAEVMPILSAAARMLRDADSVEQMRADLEARRGKPTDKVTLQVAGEFPVESERWHDWWRGFRRGLTANKEKGRVKGSSKMLCFLTGELVEPARTHPKITGLTSVGGLAMGDVLIGFKQESFRSYGLEQSANAAMSEEAAKSYQAGLNDLISNHSEMLAGTRVAHWFRKAVPVGDDPLNWLLSPDDSDRLAAQKRARQLVQGIRGGERPDLADNTYYALTLSSNGGRVVIRDWMEGSFEELAENVNRWFDDLEIAHRDGDGTARPPKLAAVLGALTRDIKDVPGSMSARLYGAAARGEPIPFAAMAQALGRARIDVIQGERANHARMGLIKAYHIRKEKRGESMLKPELNAEAPPVAYHCGRLMAVLGRLQTAALGDVGAGVVARYYAAASTTPALVFGRLVRGAQPHISKLAGDERRGLAAWYEQQMGEICGRIGTEMPPTLTLEEQSLFALGYYQQLAAMLKKREKEQEESKS
jgi:CRISPR-associated protein Csd1